MEKKGIKFAEVARVALTDTKDIVISETDKGGYAISQQVTFEGGDRVFLKGSVMLKDAKSLKAVRDAISSVISDIKADCKEEGQEITDADESWGGFESQKAKD